MNVTRSRWAGFGLMAVAALVLACSGSPDATGPIAENHPAIPLFKTQGTCVQWSCQTSVCGYDTANVGGCCTQVDPNGTAVGRPLCNPDGHPYTCTELAADGCTIVGNQTYQCSWAGIVGCNDGL